MKDEFAEKRKERVKEQNELCKLSNGEEITLRSVLIYEIFTIEYFSDLNKGLSLLYERTQKYSSSELNFKQFFKTDINTISSCTSVRLPVISNSNKKYKDYLFHENAKFDLPEEIMFIDMNLTKIMPSMIILKMNVHLSEIPSKDINKILNTFHNEEEEIINEVKIDDYRARSWSFRTPERIKTIEIKKVVSEIKNNVISFIQNYIKGIFIEFSDNKWNAIPSINIYSLNMPDEYDKMKDWFYNNFIFLNCMNISANLYLTYYSKNYIFCRESSENHYFFNYAILISEKNQDDEDHVNRRFGIISHYTDFKRIVIERWLQIQEQIVGKNNKSISDDFKYLENNDIRSIIENRKKTSKDVYQFERFRIEYKNCRYFSNLDNYISIEKKDYMLGDMLNKSIDQYITDINSIIDNINKHSNYILNIKNIEYNKKISSRMFWISVLVIILGILNILIIFIK